MVVVTDPTLSALAFPAEQAAHAAWNEGSVAVQEEQVTAARQYVDEALTRASKAGLEPSAIAIALHQASGAYSITDVGNSVDEPRAPQQTPRLKKVIDGETAILWAIDTNAHTKRIADRDTYVRLGTAPKSAVVAGRLALTAEKAQDRATWADELLAGDTLSPFAKQAVGIGAVVLRWNARRTEYNSARADAMWGQELHRLAQTYRRLVWFDPEAHEAKSHADETQRKADDIFATLEQLKGSDVDPIPGELQGFLIEKLREFHKADRLAVSAAQDHETMSNRRPHVTPHILRRAELRVLGTVVFRGGAHKLRVHKSTEKRAEQELRLEEQYDRFVGDQQFDKIREPRHTKHVLARINQSMPRAPIPPTYSEMLMDRFVSRATALLEPIVQPIVQPFRALRQRMGRSLARLWGFRKPAPAQTDQ